MTEPLTAQAAFVRTLQASPRLSRAVLLESAQPRPDAVVALALINWAAPQALGRTIWTNAVRTGDGPAVVTDPGGLFVLHLSSGLETLADAPRVTKALRQQGDGHALRAYIAQHTTSDFPRTASAWSSMHAARSRAFDAVVEMLDAGANGRFAEVGFLAACAAHDWAASTGQTPGLPTL